MLCHNIPTRFAAHTAFHLLVRFVAPAFFVDGWKQNCPFQENFLTALVEAAIIRRELESLRMSYSIQILTIYQLRLSWRLCVFSYHLQPQLGSKKKGGQFESEIDEWSSHARAEPAPVSQLHNFGLRFWYILFLRPNNSQEDSLCSTLLASQPHQNRGYVHEHSPKDVRRTVLR